MRVKDFWVVDETTTAEVLYAIKIALEILEDQLEFLYTIQTHEQAKRGAAIA